MSDTPHTMSREELGEIINGILPKDIDPVIKKATVIQLLTLLDTYTEQIKKEHLDTLQRTENVAEYLNDEDWQELGARKRQLEQEKAHE